MEMHNKQKINSNNGLASRLIIMVGFLAGFRWFTSYMSVEHGYSDLLLEIGLMLVMFMALAYFHSATGETYCQWAFCMEVMLLIGAFYQAYLLIVVKYDIVLASIACLSMVFVLFFWRWLFRCFGSCKPFWKRGELSEEFSEV